MNDWMIYLLKISCFQAVFVVFYLLFLRRLTFYTFNRAFLLVGTMVGFVLAPLHFQSASVATIDYPLMEVIATRMEQVSFMTETQRFGHELNWFFFVHLIYALGGLFFLRRYLNHFYKIKRLAATHQQINQIGAVRVFRTSYAQPFSFFKSVFVPVQVERSADYPMVMAHELQHVHYRHSYDRMLVDFVLVLFWFNPFMYLLRKSLVEVHEYQVDLAVAARHDKVNYQISLVRLVSGGFDGPVSFFNFSTIKKRITMMNKHKSNNRNLVVVLGLLPILIAMVFSFSFRMKIPVVHHQKNTVHVTVNGQPSIFPIDVKGKDQFKVSSGFGMRRHPVDKTLKLHKGIDIAAKLGTPVIATGNGEVVFAEFTEGYGNQLVIQHDGIFKTRYAQLKSFEVRVGDQVKKGQIIGQVGSSGKSTGPHLHYEVYKGEEVVNPVDYITDYQFEKH